MLKYALKECKILPNDFEKDLNLLLSSAFSDSSLFLNTLHKVIEELQIIVK